MGQKIELRVLGGFRLIVDGSPVTERWATRRSSELVQLLALAPGHRLVRDQIVEAFWPDLDVSAGMANLRKAAFHARRTLGDDAAVVLRRQLVMLYPNADVHCDLAEFFVAAEQALQRRDPAAAARVAATYAGPVLPTARYDDWAEEPRRRAASRHLDLLRLCHRPDLVLEQQATDAEACREVMEEALRNGQRHRAIEAYERHRQALVEELGVAPEVPVEVLYHRARVGAVLPGDAGAAH